VQADSQYYLLYLFFFPHDPHRNISIEQKSCWKENHSHPAVNLILEVLKDVQQLNVLSGFDQRKLPM
jgi:hypothetical protein